MSDYYLDDYREISDRQIERLIKDSINGTYDINEIPGLELEDLLKNDEEGNTYLEYFVKNEIRFNSNTLKNEIKQSTEAVYVYAKCNYLSSLDQVEEDVLFETIETGQTLAEYIVANEVGYFWFLDCIKTNPLIIDYLQKYDQSYYFSRLSSNLIDNLFTNKNGEYQIDKYLDNKELLQRIIPKLSIQLLVEYCSIKHNYNLLSYSSEETFLSKSFSDKTNLEFALENNYLTENAFTAYNFRQKETIDILLKYERYDLLDHADLELLLNNISDDKTILEFLIDKFKSGFKIQLEKLNYDYLGADPKVIAKILIILAKNGVIGFYPDIDTKLLLFKGFSFNSNYDSKKSILDYLLDYDKELTVSVIIDDIIKTDPDVSIILKSHGISNQNVNIKTPDGKYRDKYIKKFQQTYAEGCTCPCENLLLELQRLFDNDGKSDPELIDSLITSYRYLTSRSENAIEELKHLIAIKKRKMSSFIYVKTENNSYFDAANGSIHLETPAIGTLNHETGHALHFYLADFGVPKNYQMLIEKIRNNPDILVKMKEYSRQIEQLKNEVTASISRTEIAYFVDQKFANKSKDYLQEFLNRNKEAKKLEFQDHYSDDVLETVLSDIYNVDEYIASRKEIEINELVAAILSEEHEAFIAIGDILDAIFLGNYRNGVVKDKDGNYIKHAAGHGIKYYAQDIHGFDEMIANYSLIIKDKDSEKVLALLKDIVGDELVDMLSNFYTNEIVKTSRYTESEKTIYGR